MCFSIFIVFGVFYFFGYYYQNCFLFCFFLYIEFKPKDNKKLK